MAIDPLTPIPPQPERKRPPKRRSFTLDRDLAVKTIRERYEEDLIDRSDWSELRKQRYAKLRGWLEPKQYPWPNSSNAHVPLLMSDSQRMQDTLVNAVLTSRPVSSAEAIQASDAPKQQGIDELLDYQLFMEQPGEEKLQHLAVPFVEDGIAIAFIPWVRDDRRVQDVRTWPMPETGVTSDELYNLLYRLYPGSTMEQKGDFRWVLQLGKDEIDARFSTTEQGELMLVAEYVMRVFDGPCVIPKLTEDVVVPSRCENLQPPGPSNPMGAHHVILVDYPTLDEVYRLRDQGYYDLLTADELDTLEATAQGYKGEAAADPEEQKEQRDALAGQSFGTAETAAKFITRLTYFGPQDVDIDDDERSSGEECVITVLKEANLVVRARYLTEQYPCFPPRRPLASRPFIPVPGEFYGIGMLELLEHLHDLIKTTLDQSIDKNTLVNTPWGVYRAASGLTPGVVRMGPGELYPVPDPGRDIVFPSIPNPDQAFSLNLIALVNQWAERQAVLGELQFGRVPQGKASALRTVQGMQSVMLQGDARPERILRRFFSLIGDIYAQMHELNQAFLNEPKAYKVLTGRPEDNPYRQLDDPSQLRGRFRFDFKANVLNSNKALKSQILSGLAGMLVNPMTLQMGLIGPEHVYNLLADLIKANGQDPGRYMNEPSPQMQIPTFTAEEVIMLVREGQMPYGRPAEGPQGQLERLDEIEQNSPEFLTLTDASMALYQAYKRQLQQAAMQQQQMEQMMQATQAFQAGSQGFGGAPGGPQQGGQAPLQANELMDESLPTAGGGAYGAT